MTELGRLERKVVCITGAASGVGRATALRFASEGARVGLMDITGDALSEVERVIRDLGAEAVALVTDVSDESSVRSSMDEAAASLGGLDVVIANAALNSPDDRMLHEMELSAWQRVIDVNLTGAFLTCKHGLRHLLERDGGVMILTASPAALFAAAAGKPAYSASKGGIYALMKALAIEYAPNNIRVNSVIPGFTDSPFTAKLMANAPARDQLVGRIPLQRPAMPDDIAKAMVYLASDESSYVTGTALFVDGGLTAT